MGNIFRSTKWVMSAMADARGEGTGLLAKKAKLDDVPANFAVDRCVDGCTLQDKVGPHYHAVDQVGRPTVVQISPLSVAAREAENEGSLDEDGDSIRSTDAQNNAATQPGTIRPGDTKKKSKVSEYLDDVLPKGDGVPPSVAGKDGSVEHVTERDEQLRPQVTKARMGVLPGRAPAPSTAAHGPLADALRQHGHPSAKAAGTGPMVDAINIKGLDSVLDRVRNRLTAAAAPSGKDVRTDGPDSTVGRPATDEPIPAPEAPIVADEPTADIARRTEYVSGEQRRSPGDMRNDPKPYKKKGKR